MVIQTLICDLNGYAVGCVQWNKLYHFFFAKIYGVKKLIKITWILINNMSKKRVLKNINKKMWQILKMKQIKLMMNKLIIENHLWIFMERKNEIEQKI